MEGPKILTLMLEARLEVYQLIDFQYKPMPKKTDGSIDEYAKGLGNNDIWRTLVVHKLMTLNEARVRARQLNAQDFVKRQEERI